MNQLQPDKSWTLFLDRDGVINHELKDDYVKHWDEFEFLPGAVEAISKFGNLFGLIVIVTNQRGIGREIMTHENLADVHSKMSEAIELGGGKIHQIYYCPALTNADKNRKPNPGMAYQAKKEFPQIDFSKSIIAGNSFSDMEFGKNAGMHTVFITSTNPPQELPHHLIDEQYGSLYEWWESLKNLTAL